MRDIEVASAFLSSFDNCENKGEVTYGVREVVMKHLRLFNPVWCFLFLIVFRSLRITMKVLVLLLTLIKNSLL